MLQIRLALLLIRIASAVAFLYHGRAIEAAYYDFDPPGGSQER
jgi:hypothetical protein